MPTNPNSPAAPAKGQSHVGDNIYMDHFHTGLTKREYIAAMAAQGVEASNQNYDDLLSVTTVARRAVAIADALIMELNK